MSQLINQPVVGTNGQTTYYSGDSSGLQAYTATMNASPVTPPPASSSSAPQPSTPVNAGSAAPDAPSTPQGTSSAPPQDSLKPGSEGADVQQLQNYLVQMGYLTPEQMGTGAGTYGPQTTAAVAKLQKDLGITTGAGAGFYGPQTKTALASKYQNLFKSVQNTNAPDQGGAARQQLQEQVQQQNQPSSDPVFGALASSMQPILSSLSNVLSNINNPALTAVSLQQEYNTLAQQNNLPGMQADLLNMQRIMTGTEDDIRDEISKAGGTATESQILGMTRARNKVILKQYNSLATQYQAASTNVDNMMKYATSDQATQLQRDSMTASVVESMASIESQMLTMGVTMQQHATDNTNKIVTNVGYTGLAAQAQGDPQMLSYYEKTLGLSPGSLSNPDSLAQLETLRQQTVAQGAQKVNIQMYNAGLTSGNTPNNTPGGYIKDPTNNKSAIVATQSTGKDSQGRPYSLDATQAQNLLKSGASIDPGTNNIVVPGVGYYVSQSGGKYSLSIDPDSVEGKFIQYRNRAENPSPWAPSGSLSNQRMTRNSLTRQTNAALAQYVDSPLYKNVSSAATYFAKLYAGLNNPGSIGDPDIIDSLVKINTGGQGAITEQQYAAYAQGQTWGDKFQVVNGKIVSKGGTLSPDQRVQIQKLAQDTFSNYQGEYETMYVQAMKNLDNQGIPDAFWGNMPDWSGLISGATFTPLPDDSITN